MANTKVASKRGRGRPAKFSAGEIQTFKNIVRKNGLLAGHKLILDAKGVSVGGKFHALTVSLPTLGKVIKQEKGGKVVQLHRGRPVGTTKEVMEQRAAEAVVAKKAARLAKKAAKPAKSKPVVEPVVERVVEPVVETVNQTIVAESTPVVVETPVTNEVVVTEVAATPEVVAESQTV